MPNDLISSDAYEPISSIKGVLRRSRDEIVIFSPYVKVESIDKLELPERLKISIITTLRLGDLLSASSDIELYPYAKEKNIKVFINNQIHLKVFMSDWSSMIFGSSNFTRNGLGYDKQYNYELNGSVDCLDVNTICYLRKIISESILMDDEAYRYVKGLFDAGVQENKPKELDFDRLTQQKNKEFLISSLPMTKDIKRLHELINNNFESADMEEVNCAIHDQLLFELPVDLTFSDFVDELKVKFFKLEFMSTLLDYIDREDRYFGSVKAWIQDNCADVPVPSRRDLTGNIQVLYTWISFLSDGQYVVDRPKHSERIRRVKSEF